MDEQIWVNHLTGWRHFLSERIGLAEDFGERVKLSRQLGTIERVCYGAALNPSLISQFIRPIATEAPAHAFGKTHLSLNDSQKKAVSATLDESPLTLIQGPPGTGKTQVIAEICLQLLDSDHNARILVCSETHIAVNNLFARIADYARGYRLVRIRDKEGDEAIDEFSPKSIIDSHLRWLGSVCTNAEVIKIISEELGTDAIDWGSGDVSLEKALALSSNIVGMTCNRVASYDFQDATEMFDVAIIDEACKATLPEILAPLLIARKAVLVGDPMQLPPVFCSAERDVIDSIEGCNLYELMYIDELFKHGGCAITLDTQYRMVDEIGNLISNNFYDHGLINGRHEGRNDSLIWIDYAPTHDCPPRRFVRDGDTSVSNEDECRIIARLLEEIHAEEGSETRVAIISPYRAQVTMLRSMIGPFDNVAIDTVDGFQGKESDVVIFSVARTNGPFRFVDDRRRLNVALSRARDRIVVVGDLDYCRARSDLLSSIADSCKINEA